MTSTTPSKAAYPAEEILHGLVVSARFPKVFIGTDVGKVSSNGHSSVPLVVSELLALGT